MDPRSRRRLGKSNLDVTILGLGGAPLGDFYARLPEDEAIATVAAAHASGLRLFDTAPLYGFGLSEHRFGHVLRRLPHDFVLCTKVGRHLVPEKPERVDHDWFKGGLNMRPVYDYSYDGTMRAIEQSFQRLGLEQIDVLHIHDVDIWTHGSREAYEQRFREAMEGAYPALHKLREQGVIAAIGVGVNENEPLLRFAAAALQFPLGHASVAAMVPGAVKPSEVDRNIALMAHPIPADLWAELKHENLLPGHAPTPG
jgi:D-threo-aldose 1-dehydrogenase